MKFSLLVKEALLYRENALKTCLSEYFTCLLFIRRTSSNIDEKSMMADTCNTQAQKLSWTMLRGQTRGRCGIIGRNFIPKTFLFYFLWFYVS